MNFPLQGDSYRKQNAYAEMLKPSALDVPEMRIKINPGWILVNGTNYIQYAGGYSPLITAPVSNSKIVLVYLTQYGAIQKVDGDAASDPDAPDLPVSSVPIALVKVLSTSTTITNSMVSDARPLFTVNNWPTDHSDLENLDEADSHSIAAITDLQTTLDAKVESEDLTDLLEAKADITGTTSASFVLNSDTTGTPDADVSIMVERGDEANPGIKWDESADRLRFTNDGTNWKNIADTEGTDELTFTLQKTLTGSPSSNVSLVVNRGSSADASVRWNETTDRFQFTNDGTNYNNLITTTEFADKVDLVGSSDIEITDDEKGLILTSEDGSRFRVTVSNAGALVVTEIV